MCDSSSSADKQMVTDLSYLREVVMGDEEIMLETAKAFVEETPRILENMREHFSHQEWDKLYKQAHKIKPSMEYMGMTQARELILDIENQAKSREISKNMGDQIEELESICTKAIDELSDKIKELESTC